MSDAGEAHADLDLMQRIAAGDEPAVEELYDRFGSLVFRMAMQTMSTRAEAEDAVQEVFVRLWKTADRYDPERAALVTWVMLIARRHLVDRLRQACQDQEHDPERIDRGAGVGCIPRNWRPYGGSGAL